MELGWKVLIPLSLVWLLVVAAFRVGTVWGLGVFFGGVIVGSALWQAVLVGRVVARCSRRPGPGGGERMTPICGRFPSQTGASDGARATERRCRSGSRWFRPDLEAGRRTESHDALPGEKVAKPPRLHGRHVLNRYEDGMEKCIGCELCACGMPGGLHLRAGLDNPPDAPVSPGERYGFVYEINYLRCIHCDCAWRLARPKRSPSRRCSSSLSRAAPTPSTPKKSWWWTMTAFRATFRGGLAAG